MTAVAKELCECGRGPKTRRDRGCTACNEIDGVGPFATEVVMLLRIAGPLTIRNISDELGLPLQRVARQLYRVRDAGYVRSRLADGFNTTDCRGPILRNHGHRQNGVRQQVNPPTTVWYPAR
jgi:hypothetical protein